MFGWLKRRLRAAAAPDPWSLLQPGRRCRVVRAFVDHDRVTYPIGENWRLLRSTCLTYEEGLSLFVATVEGSEQQIRLQQRPEAEGAVVNALHDVLLPVADHVLLLTRDSVCLADDIAAPHAAPFDVAPDANAAGVAHAVLAAGYFAWVGSTATWSLTLGSDRVLFGYRRGRPFVLPVGKDRYDARASNAERLHVTYLAQVNPAAVIAALHGSAPTV